MSKVPLTECFVCSNMMGRTSGFIKMCTAKLKNRVERNTPADVMIIYMHEAMLKGSNTLRMNQQEANLNVPCTVGHIIIFTKATSQSNTMNLQTPQARHSLSVTLGATNKRHVFND